MNSTLGKSIILKLLALENRQLNLLAARLDAFALSDHGGWAVLPGDEKDA